MTQTVIVASDAVMQNIIKHYHEMKVSRNSPHIIFAAKLPDTTITAYKSGKVLFQGGGALREAALWGAPPSLDEEKRNLTNSSKGDKLPDHLSQLTVLGSDETGTGDFFGPITVAACFVRADQIELVKELGVKDSKQLTDDWMRKIAPDLRATLVHSVLTLKNDRYNEVQSKGWSQGKIKALLHNQALRHVLRKLDGEKPDYILIDQFAERSIYYKHIQSQREIIRENVLFATKAEGLHVAVAAASIIARVAFLEEMDRLSEIAGVSLPKGAGPKVDEVAAKILLKNGEPFLKSVTKWHFANSGKAKKIASMKRL
ncbi:ribonuclease HIII [Sporosarcina contaminans]|uniref:Ribonuclease HIII n=1 Tax=Sporosarcina contaminans TaxID=633403 RepID=A0ABW3U4L8_9BACL